MEGILEILKKNGICLETTSSNMTQRDFEQYKADDYNRLDGTLNEEDGYHCPICRDKGQTMFVEEIRTGIWTTALRKCQCWKVRRTIINMRKSGLKNIITDYTLQKFQATEEWQKKLLEAAKEYMVHPSGWFFVGGQSGAGKTHICTAICRQFLLGGKEVKYMLWRDEVVKLKSCVNDTEEYEELINGYKKAEVLYIDDLFKTGKTADGERQIPTSADVNIAFEILNYRYNEDKLTILSSECTMDAILDIDEAIGGRIYEKAKVFSLKPDKSKNYRLKGAIEL